MYATKTERGPQGTEGAAEMEGAGDTGGAEERRPIAVWRGPIFKP